VTTATPTHTYADSPSAYELTVAPDGGTPLALSLDSDFGNAGQVTTDLNDFSAEAMALQSNGAIVLAGINDDGYALARFNADGSQDTNFGQQGNNGLAYLDGSLDEATAVAAQSNNYIVAAGASSNSSLGLVVSRFTSSGIADTGFGSNSTGTVTSYLPYYGVNCTAIALDSQNRILVAGNNGSDFFLLRYTDSGTLDATFGSQHNGIVLTPFDTGSAIAFGIAFDSNDRIVVSGQSGGKVAVARYTTDGDLDTTFGDAGQTTVTLSSGTFSGGRVARLPDGNILVVGRTSAGAFALVGLNSGGSSPGSLASSFNDGAVETTSFDSAAYVKGVAVQPDGKIVVAGFSGGNFLAARYSSSGVQDTAFGTNGTLTIDFGDSDIATGLALRPDGRIVLAGYSGSNVALAQYGYVTVQFVAPTLTISGDYLATEGDTYTLTLGASGAGADTISSWRIAWGDGNTSTLAGNATTAEHVYAQSGLKPIAATAMDNTVLCSANSLNVYVQSGDVQGEGDTMDQSYYIWDHWGPSYDVNSSTDMAKIDSNKINPPTEDSKGIYGDSELCWAASASNILYWGGWATTPTYTYPNAQAVFSEYQNHWTNGGCDPNSNDAPWLWWYKGGVASVGTASVDAQYFGSAGPTHSTDPNPSDAVKWGNVYSAGGWIINDPYDQTDPSMLTTLMNEGYGIVLYIGPSDNGAATHVITCWGYTLDQANPNVITGVYVTDSDDDDSASPGNLKLYQVDETGGEHLVNYLDSGDSYYICGYQGLKCFQAQAPDGLQATTASSTSVQLNWNDNSALETGYKVQWSTDASFSDNVIENVSPANATSYTVQNLDPTKTYFFRVCATDSNISQNSVFSDVVTNAANARAVIHVAGTGDVNIEVHADNHQRAVPDNLLTDFVIIDEYAATGSTLIQSWVIDVRSGDFGIEIDGNPANDHVTFDWSEAKKVAIPEGGALGIVDISFDGAAGHDNSIEVVGTHGQDVFWYDNDGSGFTDDNTLYVGTYVPCGYYAEYAHIFDLTWSNISQMNLALSDGATGEVDGDMGAGASNLTLQIHHAAVDIYARQNLAELDLLDGTTAECDWGINAQSLRLGMSAATMDAVSHIQSLYIDSNSKVTIEGSVTTPSLEIDVTSLLDLSTATEHQPQLEVDYTIGDNPYANIMAYIQNSRILNSGGMLEYADNATLQHPVTMTLYGDVGHSSILVYGVSPFIGTASPGWNANLSAPNRSYQDPNDLALGQITSVEFLAGNQIIGSATLNPDTQVWESASHNVTYNSNTRNFACTWAMSGVSYGYYATTAIESDGLGNTVTLWAQVVGVRIPADGNGDAIVDGEDYGVWQNGFNHTPATFVTGDYNGDGIVDGEDYGAWLNGYNLNTQQGGYQWFYDKLA
jgi:uncharacterized delta-60 repeat protein